MAGSRVREALGKPELFYGHREWLEKIREIAKRHPSSALARADLKYVEEVMESEVDPNAG